MRVRPATEEDRDAVLALGVAEEVAWFGDAGYSADEVGEWLDSEGGVAQGVVAVDEDGAVRGFAALGRREALLFSEPDRVVAVGDLLLPWLRGHPGGGNLATFAGDTARVSTFERHGLRYLRSTFTLVRPDSAGALPTPVVPAGIRVAPYRLGDEDEAVHRLIYIDAAWTSVPGHSEHGLEAWRGLMRGCRSLFVARRDGRADEEGQQHEKPCPILGAKWERRPAVRCGQKPSPCLAGFP